MWTFLIHNTNLCNQDKLSTINIYALAFFVLRSKIRKATVQQEWHYKRWCYSIYKFSHNIHSKYQSVKFVAGVRVAERTGQQFLLLFLAGIGAAHATRTARPSEPFRLLRCLWCNNVGNAQNIVYGVVFILRLHDAVPVGR